MERKYHLGVLIVFIFVGCLVGGALSEIFATLFKQLNNIIAFEEVNPIYIFFTTVFEFNFGMTKTILTDGSVNYSAHVLDLYLIQIPIAFGIKINICALIGIFFSLLGYKNMFLRR